MLALNVSEALSKVKEIVGVEFLTCDGVLDDVFDVVSPYSLIRTRVEDLPDLMAFWMVSVFA